MEQLLGKRQKVVLRMSPREPPQDIFICPDLRPLPCRTVRPHPDSINMNLGDNMTSTMLGGVQCMSRPYHGISRTVVLEVGFKGVRIAHICKLHDSTGLELHALALDFKRA